MSKNSKAWYRQQSTDFYVRSARKDQYRSRAAYKLLEIQKTFKLLSPQMDVLDLGSTPGSWSQILATIITKGKIIAVDKLPMHPIHNVNFIQGDFQDSIIQEQILKMTNGKIDFLLSDMAPDLSGIAVTDQSNALSLAISALDFSTACLKIKRGMLIKFFQGEETKEFHHYLKKKFASVKIIRPLASRNHSREIYYLAQDFLG